MAALGITRSPQATAAAGGAAGELLAPAEGRNNPNLGMLVSL